MSNTPVQQHLADNTLSHEEQQIIRDFSELLEARMVSGASMGFSDWQDTDKFPDHKLRIMLVKALREADWGSVAAYAMMAQHRGLKVVDVNGRFGLPRSVFVGEELDHDFVNIWTRRDEPATHMGNDFPCPGEIDQAEAEAQAPATATTGFFTIDKNNPVLEKPLLHPDPDRAGDAPQRPIPPRGTIRTEGILGNKEWTPPDTSSFKGRR